MARGFWQEKERYLETYWRRFQNIWVHGDWAMRDEDGHWYILGRSDDTLKVAGKRVGPAEVERCWSRTRSHRSRRHRRPRRNKRHRHGGILCADWERGRLVRS